MRFVLFLTIGIATITTTTTTVATAAAADDVLALAVEFLCVGVCVLARSLPFSF